MSERDPVEAQGVRISEETARDIEAYQISTTIAESLCTSALISCGPDFEEATEVICEGVRAALAAAKEEGRREAAEAARAEADSRGCPGSEAVAWEVEALLTTTEET